MEQLKSVLREDYGFEIFAPTESHVTEAPKGHWEKKVVKIAISFPRNNISFERIITNELLFRSNELLFPSNELLFRSLEILFRSLEILFRSNELLFRSNEILFRGNEIIFRGNEILFVRTK